ncbi:hypothetical protein [Streptomyces sp. NBC_01589]|uniref:hypothetical protein n=1 Tax=unclassified Streptomyces TaxID=2593676 RepID=UPI00386A2CB1
MVDTQLTHQQALGKVVRALGGTWDAQRAVLALRVAGYQPADQQTAEKEARRNLRLLAESGLIVKTDPDRAVYELA